MANGDNYTLCQTVGGSMYIDIGVNGSVQRVNLVQWYGLKYMFSRIDTSINKAESYWRSYLSDGVLNE
jgi:hypothetical protein